MTSVIDGNVESVSADGTTQLTTDGGYTLAYVVGSNEILGRSSSVVVQPTNGGPPHTFPDVTLIGAGVYQGRDVAITLDVHPDVLHDDERFIRLMDVETGAITVAGTELSIAPGSTLDHVSIAGDLFVMSGFSPEGGPFVLYQHSDGSFDNSLPNVVAGNLTIGKVRNAVISPDGTRIAYLVSGDLAVNDVATGSVMERVPIATKAYIPTALDFDGRYAVVSRTAKTSVFVRQQPDAMVVDTTAAQPTAVDLPGTTGITTVDR